MSLGSSNPQMGSFMNLSTKRDALWNVVEPGDPYDIRKSMIAKVPGDKKNFMGDYLEIVCLFQAAQIERLCEFLDDFKLKYREIERRELDRHSYEIQIKELNHKLAEQSSFREENQKLREFIKNINSNKQEQEDSIRAKFQRLLIQFKNSEDQNARLRQQNQILNSQISTFDAKYEALRKSKQTEIQQIYSRLNQQQSNLSYQFELNSLKNQYESEIERISLENQRLKQVQDQNLRHLAAWQQKYRALQQQIFKNQPQQDTSKYERSIAEYQNRFMIFGQQIDRLNLVVRDITAKFQISEQKNRDFQNKLQAANREFGLLQNKSDLGNQQNQELLKRIQDLQNQIRRLQQSGTYSEENDSKLRFANEQIIRLNNQVRLQIQKSNRLKAELSRFQYQGSKVNILEKQLYESKQIAAENNSLKLQIAEKQNKIAFLKQQIQRLNEELFKKGGLDSNYQTLLNEYQRLQRAIQELERRNQVTVQEYESRIVQKVNEYESRIELINRTKGSQFESRASLLQGQVQRLGELIQKRNEQIQNLQRQNREIKTIQSQTQFEINRKIQNYESVIQGLKRQNEQMTRRMRELEVFQRKSSEYENKHTIISQQVDRLNYQLKNKDMDIENLKIKLRDQEIAIIQRYEIDTSRKLGTYQMNLNNLARQNQQFKRKYAEMENKTALLSQQIQRLSHKLRQVQTLNTRYQQQIPQLQKTIRDTQINLKNMYETQITQKQSSYQMTIRNLQGQTDQQIRRKLLELENSNKKIIDYERALEQVSKQLQRLGAALRQKNQENLQIDNKNKALSRQFQDLSRKYTELQNMVRSKYQVEASTRITNLEQNISVFTRQNQQLKRYIQDYQNRLKDQNVAIEQLNVNLRNYLQQNDGLKRQIQETQFSYRNKLDVQVTNQYRIYEKTISDIKKDLENLVKQNTQLKNTVKKQAQNITILTQDDERLRRQVHGQLQESYYKVSQLDGLVGQLKNQNENLKRSKDQVERTFRQYEAEATQKIALLAQQHQRILNHLQNKTEQLKKTQDQVKQLTNKLQLLERSMNQSQSSVQQYEMQVNTRISQYQQNITILTQQNAELQNKLKTINELNYKIADYENKIVIINQQLERVNINLRRQVQKSSQLENSLRNAVVQNNQLTKNITDLKNSISQKYEVQATRTIRTLQQNIQLFQNQNEQLKNVITRYEQEINNRGVQIQKLTTNLNNLTEQNKHLKNQIRETQVFITQRYQTEATSRYTAYERDIANYQKQIDDLMKKLIEYAERVVPQYENQTVTLRQQIQRLNARFNQDNSQLASNLNLLSQENEAFKKQIAQLQIFIQKEQTQTKQKSSSYEQNLVLLQRENEDLKRYIQQFGGHYEGLGQSHQNLERQIQQYRMKVQSQTKKSELLQKDLNNLSRENNELKRRLVQMQQQIQRVIGKLNELSQQNQRIRRQARQNEMELSQRLQMETVQQVNLHKQQLVQMDSNLKGSQREIQILQKKLSDLGLDASKKINSYDQELKRLVNQIEQRNITIRELDNKLVSILNENQQLKKHFQQTEINFNRTFQTQIKNRTITYQQTIQNITKQAQSRQKEILQNSNKRIMELQNKAVLLAQQLERLNQILKSKHEENQIMHQEIQRLTNTLRLQIQQNKQLQNQHVNLRSHTQTEFMQLQSSYELIIKENQKYKKSLLEYESSIQKLYAEFERLQKIINNLKAEKQSVIQKNFELSKETQRQSEIIKSLQIEVEEVRLRLSDQAALHKRISEHMALMVILFAEIESLRKRVKDKQKEVEDVRRSSLAPFKLQSRQIGDKN